MVYLLALIMFYFTCPAEPIRFIHPKATMMIAQIGGTEVKMQVRLELEPEDRWLDVDVMSGELRVGGFSKELEGTDSYSIQPFYNIHTEKHGAGNYYIVARICRSKTVRDNRTVCDTPRATAAKEFKICGGDQTC